MTLRHTCRAVLCCAVLCCVPAAIAVLEYCPEWRPGTNNQGVTAADRPEPMLNIFSELTLDEYKAGEGGNGCLTTDCEFL